MKHLTQLFKIPVLAGGIFFVAFFFASLPANAQNWRYDDDNYRPSESWVRQQGREKGYQLGTREGAQDRVQNNRYDYSDETYDYALNGFKPQWVHDDNYKKGFREGYKQGYENGYQNPRSVLNDWRYGNNNNRRNDDYYRTSNNGRNRDWNRGRDQNCDRDDDYYRRNNNNRRRF
ncbi:MAG: hypothetical protein HY774_24300 [Acidobacteria bacterium]|nr:hypothetical protein [Acidobacteriota bacterium]